MKNFGITRTVVVVLVLLCSSVARSEAKVAPMADTITDTRVVHLQNRLEEIKLVNTDALSSREKKMLRREVREIKKELASISGGVYLSVGAIILIALLLILLL